jgi:phosphatidylserine/phosphatidylglycerophosphate/cardiolipin synthase-like enzyme
LGETSNFTCQVGKFTPGVSEDRYLTLEATATDLLERTVRPGEWFLTPAERGNPATRIDARRSDGMAYSTGNLVRPLIHGSSYFAELVARIPAMVSGDLLLFSNWRGDPDQRMSEAGHEVSELFCSAARRGVVVRGLVWRANVDRFERKRPGMRDFGEEIEAAGGRCLLDMRVRPSGSQHMKLVILRHRDRRELDVAFIGGIDLCHGRRDDASHQGDPQCRPMAAAYGTRPPWHDIQAMISGPAVGDAEMVFRERWEDPTPLTRDLVHRLRKDDGRPRTLPPQGDDPSSCGPHAVQLLRTYPYRRTGYSFAPNGERSIARAYLKVLKRARRLIYLEDQYLWSATAVSALATALRETPELRLIAVIPRFPPHDGRFSASPTLIGRLAALRLLYKAAGPRVAVYYIENEVGTPIYVHAKVCIVDASWAIVGSDNFNRRSWSHDSELSCAVIDTATEIPCAGESGAGAHGYVESLRQALASEHLGIAQPGMSMNGNEIFNAFKRTASALDAWYAADRRGPRPPGRLRRYHAPPLATWTRIWAGPIYRLLYDPDGRPSSMRRAGEF